MPVVNNLVNDLIDQHKVFSNGLFVEDSAVISEHFHHSVDDVHHKTWRNIVFGGRNEVDSKFLREEIVEALDILQIQKLNGDLRMRVEDHHPKGSPFGKKLHMFLCQGLDGLNMFEFQ